MLVWEAIWEWLRAWETADLLQATDLLIFRRQEWKAYIEGEVFISDDA